MSLPPPPPSKPAPVVLPPPPPGPAQPFGSTQQFAGLSSPLPPPPPKPVSWTALPLFQGLSDEALRHFRAAMEVVEYPDGAEILR